MSKTTKGLIVVALVGAAVYGIYHVASKTKRAYAKAIVKNGGAGSLIGLLAFDEAYLKEWAYAIRKGKTSFEYNGKLYNSSGGKEIPKTVK